MVTNPTEDGKVVFIKDGQAFGLRMFSGRSVYSFNSNVLRACAAPYPYCHLSYPSQVEAVAVRKAHRIKVNLIAAVANLSHDPLAAKQACNIQDLSVSGAQIVSRVRLGETGDSLVVSVRFIIADNPVVLDIQGRVRNSRKEARGEDENAEYVYGVEFDDLPPTSRMAVQSYIYQLELERR